MTSNISKEFSPSTRAIIVSWSIVIIGVFAPLLGVGAAAVLAGRYGYFGWTDFILFFGMYILGMIGITVGFHRLFTHRSFEATKPVQFVLGVLGSMSFQGRLLEWVGRHRIHHQHSDQKGDPHSPHVPHGPGFWGRIRGFLHAHVGWALAPDHPGLEKYAPDLLKSRMICMVSSMFLFWAVLGLLIPAGLGYAINGWMGALTGFLWGGLVRVFLAHHATWSVNSICHLWGRRRYATSDKSRNNLLVGVLALGEGWHNNHHAFPTSTRFGHRWWELDLGYYVIRLLAMLGLAWKLKKPPVPMGQNS